MVSAHHGARFERLAHAVSEAVARVLVFALQCVLAFVVFVLAMPLLWYMAYDGGVRP